MKWVNRLYIFFLGIIFAITTGFGIAAFYPQPMMPQFTSTPMTAPIPESCNATPKQQQSKECQTLFENQQKAATLDEKKSLQNEKDMETYRNINAGYTRTAIFFGIVIGAIYALFGLTMIKKSKLIATGLLLASVLTAILTRLLIGLASLGSSVGGTAKPDTVSYLEFAILLILSGVVVFVGLNNLKDD